MSIILILLGIACEVVKANAWIMIPDFVSYVLFGLAGLMIIIEIISWIDIKRQHSKLVDKINKKLNKW